jgi:ribose-phosphate pyrophosphokinase
MIKLYDVNSDKAVTIKPTLFPDGTSQVWKLPSEFLTLSSVLIEWKFQSEREIIDLYSLVELLGPSVTKVLEVPFLPFARQDKIVSNDTTFNLKIFATLINNLNFSEVRTVDAHNPIACKLYIKHFVNYEPTAWQMATIKECKPDFLMFPDTGAKERYLHKMNVDIPIILCEKIRDQATGKVTSVIPHFLNYVTLKDNANVLIIDDICDGGATFIDAAKALHDLNSTTKVNLFVTHGIFSKGKDHLLKNGINEIYNTDSLIQNKEGIEV